MTLGVTSTCKVLSRSIFAIFTSNYWITPSITCHLEKKKQKAKVICCPPNGQCEKKWAAAGKIQVRLYIKFANKKDREVLEQSA